MPYRLFAVDLDGTLLRRDHSIDDADIGAIRELQAAGVTVTIVTGRVCSGALGAARSCAIEGPIGCMEGSHLFEVGSSKTLLHHSIATETAELVRTVFGAHGLSTFVFDADGIHHDHAGAAYVGYVRTWSPNLRVVEEHLAWQTLPLGAIAIGEPDVVATAHAALLAHADRLFSVAFPVYPYPGKHALMVRAAGTNKGTALAELCRLASCTLAEAIVVGDWTNDVPMFEVAGRSFVMGGAPDAIRNKATDSLTRLMGTGGGIAEAVRRVWG